MSENMEPDGDQDVSSFLLTPGKDEMNFAEHPIALLTDRVPKSQRSLIYEDTVYSQRRKKLIPRKRVIEGSQEYGLPTATDDTVILALIQLTKLKNQFKNREVEFTRLELIQLLCWPNEGKNYERIKISLMRLKGVQYFYDNAWWDARLRDWTTRAFNIIDNVEINDSRIADGQGGLFPSRITWNEVVFESFQAGFLRNIDFQLCMRLKHPTSLRMYRYLGKQFYAKPDITFELKVFAEANLGLGRNYEGGTQIARKLKPAIKELEEVGFLEPLADDVRFVKNGREWSIRFIQKGAADTVPHSVEAAPATPSPLLEELTKRGVTEKTAAELIALHSAAKIEEKLEHLDWRLTRPKPPKEPAGYLVKSIIDDYAMPKGFVSRAERHRLDEARQARERKAAEERRREQESEASSKEELAAIDAYIRQLTSAQRTEYEAAALAHASDELRQNYHNPALSRFRETLLLGMLREHIRPLLKKSQLAFSEI